MGGGGGGGVNTNNCISYYAPYYGKGPANSRMRSDKNGVS